MIYGSVCSGIEAASVAWHPLGWRPAFFSEIEPFPSSVLAHHYPEVPSLGDMTALPARIRAGEVEAPDLLCGGTPCQAFSVAGLRRSLDDARGNLSLTFCEIANAIDAARAARGEQPASMARDAGWTEYSVRHAVEVEPLVRFAELVAAAEREICAQVCEDLIGTRAMARHCADAIRERGEK